MSDFFFFLITLEPRVVCVTFLAPLDSAAQAKRKRVRRKTGPREDASVCLASVSDAGRGYTPPTASGSLKRQPDGASRFTTQPDGDGTRRDTPGREMKQAGQMRL